MVTTNLQYCYLSRSPPVPQFTNSQVLIISLGNRVRRTILAICKYIGVIIWQPVFETPQTQQAVDSSRIEQSVNK